MKSKIKINNVSLGVGFFVFLLGMFVFNTGFQNVSAEYGEDEFSNWSEPVSYVDNFSNWNEPVTPVDNSSNWYQTTAPVDNFSNWYQQESAVDNFSNWNNSLNTVNGNFNPSPSVPTMNGNFTPTQSSIPVVNGNFTPQQNLQRVLSQQVAQQPNYAQPRYSQPSYSQPRTSTPSYSYPAPTYNPPTYRPPTYQPPTYQPPTYQPPVYIPPVQQCTRVAPTASMSPTRYINAGNSTSISWNSYQQNNCGNTYISYCVLNGGVYSNTRVEVNGSRTVSPWATTNYNVTCYNNYGQTAYANTQVIVQSINTNYCTNGATNYPYCNNQYVPPVYVPPTPTPCYSCNTPIYTPPVYVPPVYTPIQTWNDYQDDCNQCNNVGRSTVITRLATAIGTTYAQLNGAFVDGSNSGQRCVSFFDYGRNGNLGTRTVGQALYSNYTTNYFSQAVYGLSPYTTYSYRAGVTCLDGTKYGNVYQFTTKGNTYTYVKTGTRTVKKTVATTYLKPVTKVAQTATCTCDNDYLNLSVKNVEGQAVIGNLAKYKITFKSIASSTLENVAIKIVLPDELSIYDSERGTFVKGGKTLTYVVPLMQAFDEGSFILTTSVANNVTVGNNIVVNGYANYTVSNALKQGKPLSKEATAYSVVLAGNANTAMQNNTSKTNWLPTNLFDWMIFIAVFAVFLAALRYLFTAFQRAGTRE